ncbi:hypothetical protein, partial [Haloparvum sedimenti]|uniref:hypothetical protein n=1 Tax=Haloparvum sedimenti TaxID=1678448 RepID=UPI00159EF023
SAGISNEGDYWTRALTELVIPIVLGSFIAGSTKRWAIKKAKVGPMWGYGRWIILLAIATGFAVVGSFSSIAEVIASAPIIVALLVVAIVFIVLIESDTDRVERWEFNMPKLTSASSPSGEDVLDAARVDTTTELVARTEEDGYVVIKPGLFPFISRMFGGSAPLEGQDQIDTQIDVTRGRDDKKVFVEPDGEYVLDYKPEGWSLQLPSLESTDDKVGFAIRMLSLMAVAAVVATAWSSVVGILVYLAGMLALFARPTKGHARIEPAPAHGRSAWLSMLYLSMEYSDAESLQEARERLVKEQARADKDVDEALQKSDRTLVEEMFNTDPDDAAFQVDEPDREVASDD